MSSNGPQVEQERDARIERWADCVQRMAAMCGGVTRPDAACCRGATNEQPITSEETRSGHSCQCGTSQAGAAKSGPEML